MDDTTDEERTLSRIRIDAQSFDGIGRTWYPDVLMERIRSLPNARARLITADTARKDYRVELVQPGDPRAQLADY